MDVESEIQELRRRVGALEGAVSVLTGQMREVHPELVRLRRDNTEQLGRLETHMSGMLNRLDTMNAQVWSLRDDLPDMIGRAVAKEPGNRR